MNRLYIYARSLTRIVACIIPLLAGSAQAQELNPPLAEGEGEIQALSFGTNEAIIGGYQYGVAETVRVEINGTFGAFTMLQNGMLVEFDFLQYSDGYREIVGMREVNEIEGI